MSDIEDTLTDPQNRPQQETVDPSTSRETHQLDKRRMGRPQQKVQHGRTQEKGECSSPHTGKQSEKVIGKRVPARMPSLTRMTFTPGPAGPPQP